MTRPPPYLVVWTGPKTGLEEHYVSWSLADARILAKTRKARIYRLKIAEEVE